MLESMKRQRIFFDLDGVLAVWQHAPIEEVAMPGYFSALPEQENVVKAFKLMRECSDIELYILSSVFVNGHSEADKRTWVSVHLNLPEAQQIYCPYGQEKAAALEKIGGADKSDVLLDDFSRNLRSWPGIPIKLYNGINGTKGSWDGYSVHASMKPEILARRLYIMAHFGLEQRHHRAAWPPEDSPRWVF